MTGKTERKQLRSFGLMVGGIFAVIGLWPIVMSQPPRWWAVGGGSVLVTLGGVAPGSLTLPYKGWMAVGHVLGWVNTRIILGIVFYGLLTPLGLIRRVLGHDTFKADFEPERETYRIPKSARPATHLKHQF
jgi:hypothetical protein